jgi:hypothetical protein
MSSPRVRSRRGRVWRSVGLAGVSLGLAAGCLLNKVEFDGPETQQNVNDLDGTGGTGAETPANGGTGPTGTGGSVQDACSPMTDAGECVPAAPLPGPAGSNCASDRGCLSRSCSMGLCLAPTCDDEIVNQDETDQDCGGVCERGCAEAQACLVDGDCGDGLFCPPETRRCTPASCQDRTLNGSEILTDCGGGVCPGCPNGTPCTIHTDCASGNCGADSVCEGSTCEDGALNGTETGVDCGGLCPAACETAIGCERSEDCQSGVCDSPGCPDGVALCCSAPACNDEVLNGQEVDVDCGGTCGPCPDLSICVQPSDCFNSNCSDGVCISCGDDTVNGTETDRDCGGSDPSCRRCNPGEACRESSDCATGLCLDGFC